MLDLRSQTPKGQRARAKILAAAETLLVTRGFHGTSVRDIAAAAGLLIGPILEAGQIALQSRTPSMTDVLLFGGAAWTGAVVCARYRRIRDART